MTVSSEPLALEVLPFPEKGKPELISAALWGNLPLKVQPFRIGGSRMGDSVTLTLRLSGNGNVNRLPDLKMPALDHLKTLCG